MEFFKIWMAHILYGAAFIGIGSGVFALFLFSAQFYPAITLVTAIIGVVLSVSYMMAKDEYEHRKRFK